MSVRPEHYEDLVNRGWRRYVLVVVGLGSRCILIIHMEQIRDIVLQTKLAALMLSALHIEVSIPTLRYCDAKSLMFEQT